MSFLKKSELKKFAETKNITEAASRRELRAFISFSPERQFDIFLSHRKLDALEVNAVVTIIKECGYSVYVDWHEDPELDPSKITIETAKKIKTRMNQCRSLIFLTSESFSDSKWMPWELGYLDGRTGKSSIFPIIDDLNGAQGFQGQEYLLIYPRITVLNDLFVCEGENSFINYRSWLEESQKKIKGSIYG